MQALSLSYVLTIVEHSGTLRNNARSRTERSDQTGAVPNTRGPPNRLSASRARWMRSTGRRRRPRPTSRRLMSAPLGWTGRAQRTTLGIDCQGLFSDRRTKKQVIAVAAALAREAAGEERASAGFAGRAGRHGDFGRSWKPPAFVNSLNNRSFSSGTVVASNLRRRVPARQAG